MRIVFTGGGTGGHILPNLAIIAALKNNPKDPNNPKDLKNPTDLNILYIGEKGGVEEKIMERHNIPFQGIRCGKLRRYFDLKNAIDVFKVPIGIVQTLKILRAFKPHVVFAKGGYVSVPVVVAAWLLRIPVVIHESDVTPGLATRLCRRFAKEVLTSWGDSAPHCVGNPVRPQILHGPALLGEKGYAFTGFNNKKPVVLIIGGSSGAQAINELVEKSIEELTRFCQVVQITGSRLQVTGSRFQVLGYRQFEYIDVELADVYAIADLIVSRAGANALSEIAALQKPNILIPLPVAASRGDQAENAALFAKEGASVVLPQDGLTAERLVQEIKLVLESKTLQQTMKKGLKKLYKPDAAEKIAEVLLKYHSDERK